MKYLNILFLALVVTFATSCEELLELEPEQSLSEAAALADVDAMQTALFGAYDRLQQVNYYGREFIVIPDVEGNLVYLTIDNSNRFVGNYTYQFTTQNGDFTGMWNDAYEAILSVNNIINNIDALEGDAATKNQIKGEALFIRAMAHFDLVRYFAKPYTNSNPSTDLGVPIVLEAKIDEPPRNTISEVYSQVIADLNASKPLLSSINIFRFSPDAVDALLARVYLYQGDNSSAVNSASAIINSGNYSLAANFQEMFNDAGSSEEIFSLRMTSAENRGSDNLGQIYNPSGYGDIRVSQDLVDLYGAGDQRADLIYTFDDGELYHTKYPGQDGLPGLASPKLLRLGEMHLIRAEANFKLGNTTESLDELNALRAARGAEALTAVDLATIIAERQRELAFEGHTTFDLFRNGLSMVRTQCNTGLEVNGPCTIEPSNPLAVHPIPQREIDVNDNMVQNPGY